MRIWNVAKNPAGFVSLDAQNAEGSLTTVPLALEGKTLHLNAVAKPGYVLAEVLDEAGEPIDGLTRDDCVAVEGDSLDHAVAWTSGKDLSALAGRAVRLRFILRGAKLFSFWMT